MRRITDWPSAKFMRISYANCPLPLWGGDNWAFLSRRPCGAVQLPANLKASSVSHLLMSGPSVL